MPPGYVQKMTFSADMRGATHDPTITITEADLDRAFRVIRNEAQHDTDPERRIALKIDLLGPTDTMATLPRSQLAKLLTLWGCHPQMLTELEHAPSLRAKAAELAKPQPQMQLNGALPQDWERNPLIRMCLPSLTDGRIAR